MNIQSAWYWNSGYISAFKKKGGGKRIMRNFKIEFDANSKEQLAMKLKVLEYNIIYLDEKCENGNIGMKWLGNKFIINEPIFKKKIGKINFENAWKELKEEYGEHLIDCEDMDDIRLKVAMDSFERKCK